MGFRFTDTNINSDYNNDYRTSNHGFFNKFIKKLTKKTSVLDLLPYKSMNSYDEMVNLNNYVEDFYLVRGKALKNTSKRQGLELISDFNFFIKTYVTDVKIIVSMYPTETFNQQNYFIFKMQEAKNNIIKYQKLATKSSQNDDEEHAKLYYRKVMQYRNQIKYNQDTFLRNEINASKALKNQEYLMVIYGKNHKEIKGKVEDIKRWGGEALELEQIDADKKINKIATFLNPTQQLFKN